MKIRYIGNFPPPYGGVTIKNKLLFDILSQRAPVIRFAEWKHIPKKVHQLFNMLLALVSRNPLIIGISAVGGKSKLLTRLLYVCNRRTMQKSLYFMMGGLEAGRIAANPEELKWYGNYRQIYVETRTMAACLQNAGLTNVGFYPNCRRKPDQPITVSDNRRGPLKCVFFSLIQPMKGADNILAAAELLPDVEFTFWGHISPEYKDEFLSKIENRPNVKYLGVFSGSSEAVYAELANHDLLLLPTKWASEGVPGILPEAKIAGIPAIVSNMSYNAELIEDKVAGTVLHENTSEALAEAIRRYDTDRELLLRHKENALRSADGFFIETYLEEILSQLAD